MPRHFKVHVKKRFYVSFNNLHKPLRELLPSAPVLKARGNRPLQMNFEDQLNALIFLHLEEHDSGRHLLQFLDEDSFAQEYFSPESGIKKSSFFEAINTRGLEQLQYIFQELYAQNRQSLPKEHAHLGELMAIDGSLIKATLSMHWADYRKNSKKAKVHLGFDINRGVPAKIFLTSGKGPERPFVSQLLSPGQTAVLDRGFQAHHYFDLWQAQGQLFVARIRKKTTKTCIRENEMPPGSMVFYDSMVLLGTPAKQTQNELRVIAYRVGNVEYWIATNRYDLTAEEIATIYKLRWNIETFFAWWKRHLKVYHLIARSEYGMMVQILSGLITYLLLAIYCHKEHNENVSIRRVRELRIKIQNEARQLNDDFALRENHNDQELIWTCAKT
jgi:hypothetical protein